MHGCEAVAMRSAEVVTHYVDADVFRHLFKTSVASCAPGQMHVGRLHLVELRRLRLGHEKVVDGMLWVMGMPLLFFIAYIKHI